MNERTPVSAYRFLSCPRIKQIVYVNFRGTLGSNIMKNVFMSLKLPGFPKKTSPKIQKEECFLQKLTARA